MGMGKRPSLSAVESVMSSVVARLSACEAAGLDAGIRECLAAMGRAVGIDRACLISFSDDYQTFTMTHEWHGEGIHSQLDYFVNLPITTFPWTARQLLEGKPVPIDRLDDYPPEAEMERQICLVEKNQSIVFVPVRVHGRITGTIAMDGIRAPHAWTPSDLVLLEVAGAYMATLLDARRTNERMETVSRHEREKLGRDLHDSLGQQLIAISLLAASLQGDLKRNRRLAAQAARIAELTTAVVQTARDMTRGLQPFDVKVEGLVPALRRMADETKHLLGVECRVVDNGAPPVQDPEACTQLFWIAREAVNNAIRHGKATAVTITLDVKGGRQFLTVRDNGRGLPADWGGKVGVGLKVMRFRAAVMGGQVTVASGADAGVEVTCVFPLGGTPSLHGAAVPGPAA